MIRTKQDLREFIEADNHFQRPRGLKGRAVADFASYPNQTIRKYLYYLRMQEYYINTAGGSRRKGLLGLWYERKKNKLGMRIGIEIGPNCAGKGLSIWHVGNIIINPGVRIGEYCTLHGGNCIGNNGKDQQVPRIGNHVDIGFGAVIIGGIEIADDCVIGANAVVNRSCREKGSVIVGIPGKARPQK